VGRDEDTVGGAVVAVGREVSVIGLRAVTIGPMTRLHAALIDLDGTLIDTIGDFEAALTRTLADLGAPPVPRAFIARTVGKGSEYLLRQTLAQAGLAPERYDAAWVAYQGHYRALNGDHAQVFDGVVAGLERFASAGWRLGCLTNKPGEFARALLERKGLHRWFDFVYGGDAFARRKPDPMPLIEGCRTLGLPPASVLMIGDSANDAMAARAAGCPVVLVRHGYNHGEPVESAGADRCVDRLDQVDPDDPLRGR
jgi:phosphoglycolate phosphatase